jgi:hypothetical protein
MILLHRDFLKVSKKVHICYFWTFLLGDMDFQRLTWNLKFKNKITQNPNLMLAPPGGAPKRVPSGADVWDLLPRRARSPFTQRDRETGGVSVLSFLRHWKQGRRTWWCTRWRPRWLGALGAVATVRALFGSCHGGRGGVCAHACACSSEQGSEWVACGRASALHIAKGGDWVCGQGVGARSWHGGHVHGHPSASKTITRTASGR